MSFDGSFLGRTTLVAGTKVIADTRITANSAVFPSNNGIGGTIGIMWVVLNPGVGFTINSGNILDTSVVSYIIFY